MSALKGSPATKALAVRVYAHCKAFGWNVPMRDVADAMGVTMPRLRRCVILQGWGARFKATASADPVWASISPIANPATLLSRNAQYVGLSFKLDGNDD